MRHTGNTPKRKAWMAKTTSIISARRPETYLFDWDTLIYLYNEGNTPEQAATRYLSSFYGKEE